MGRWPDKYVIGLTGNLAMGKSLVRRMLEHLGAYTIDAGGLAYQAMAPGAPAYKPVIETFGMWILDSDKRIDRAKLAAVSFSHPLALRYRQSITQPIVGRAIDTLIPRAKHQVVVVEAIDLLEGALGSMVDAIWVVNSSAESQVSRLVASGISEWEARKRIELQNPQQDKLDRAAVVIQNNGTPDEVWLRVQTEWNVLQQRLGLAAVDEPDVPVAVAVEKGAPALKITEVAIKRGTPRIAEEIARLLTSLTGNAVTRMDVMMSFGQKSYQMAIANESYVGLVGFQVENLITRVDEFYVLPQAMQPVVVEGLIDAVEAASKELQSEIGFFFLPEETPQMILDVFEQREYLARTLKEIKVPAWREAARESQPDGTRILAKKLRAERVLKPL